MSNKSLKIDEKELGSIMLKLKEIGATSQEFHKELENTSRDIEREARAKFNATTLPLLERRGEDTKGLTSSIKARTRKRKDSESSYQISAGGLGKEIMAYSEFGTRTRNIALGGIRALFGAEGDAYAKRFKGGDDPNKFTHLSARPYFFNTVYKQKKKMKKRIGDKISKALRK